MGLADNAAFITKIAVLSSFYEFMRHKIDLETILDQPFRNSKDYGSVVDRLVIARVAVCTIVWTGIIIEISHIDENHRTDKLKMFTNKLRYRPQQARRPSEVVDNVNSIS